MEQQNRTYNLNSIVLTTKRYLSAHRGNHVDPYQLALDSAH